VLALDREWFLSVDLPGRRGLPLTQWDCSLLAFLEIRLIG
jgi:hypothetical protein